VHLLRCYDNTIERTTARSFYVLPLGNLKMLRCYLQRYVKMSKVPKASVTSLWSWCIAPSASVDGGDAAVKKDVDHTAATATAATTPLKPDNVNCRIFSAEGECTPLELLLSFFGDTGYEVGSPIDLSTLTSKKWKENGEELGVTYEGTDGADSCSKLQARIRMRNEQSRKSSTFGVCTRPHIGRRAPSSVHPPLHPVVPVCSRRALVPQRYQNTQH
jgi:hypothetical protein